MDEQTVQQLVKEVMSAILTEEPADIGPDSSIDTVERWDSLQHVNLMMALEQQFCIRIDVEDAVEMTTFPAVCETIIRYVGAGQ